MALLDLQGMESPAPTNGGGGHGGHGGNSDLSVTLCNSTSGLSVLICQ
jgi:hypothetical protein